MLFAKGTKLTQFNPVRCGPFVFCCNIISPLTIATSHCYFHTHYYTPCETRYLSKRIHFFQFTILYGYCQTFLGNYISLLKPVKPGLLSIVRAAVPRHGITPKEDQKPGRLSAGRGTYYSIIEVATPEATVRPPSRMAKRSPSSIAMGVISSILICTLSPGITISTPSGRPMTPVTSVVRR